MREALLDADIMSEILKGRDAGVRARAQAYLAIHGRLTTSALTLLEIAYGFERVGRHKELEIYLAQLARMRLLAFEPDEGELAGRILGELERTGRPIGQLDPMIAAIAITRKLVLVTGNTSDYQHIANAGYLLELDDWRSPATPLKTPPRSAPGRLASLGGLGLLQEFPDAGRQGATTATPP